MHYSTWCFEEGGNINLILSIKQKYTRSAEAICN
jgi:hypothetical protein